MYLTEPESGDLDDEEGFSDSNKSAISHLILGDGDDADTDIDAGGLAILNKLLQAFPGPTGPDGTYYTSGTAAANDRAYAINPEKFPYYVENIDPSTFVIDIEPYDKKANGSIPVTFTTNVDHADLVTLGFVPATAATVGPPAVELKLFTKADIKNAASTFTVTLTSKTAGTGDKSTIGEPQDTGDVADGITANTGYGPILSDITTDTKAYVRYGDNSGVAVQELVIKGTAAQNTIYPYWSTAPQKGVDAVGVTTGTEDKSRLTWL